MPTISDLIRDHEERIVALWSERARSASSAKGLDQPLFENLMPKYLLALASAGPELGRNSGERRHLLEAHLATRIRQGFELAAILDELGLLADAIADVWAAAPEAARPDARELERLEREIHLASTYVGELFAEHMREDEQVEKRYARALEDMTRAAVVQEKPLSDLLRGVVALVMEAMRATTAALVVYDRDDGDVEAAVTVGAGCEVLESMVTSLAPETFVGQVAARETTTTVYDVETTKLEISDTLRSSGVHALIGVRLPPRHRVAAILYVGIAEHRSFRAQEARRLEFLGDRLLLHVDNLRLFSELRAHVDALQVERGLREQFVNVLAHDLRGPLTTAKTAARLLAEYPARLDERRDLAIRIERSVDRTDRMVRDLLDANRIRVGEPLALRIEPCDLEKLARDVADELAAIHGDRFVVAAEGDTRGAWSVDELHRALWNLATNAIKYGAQDRPITVHVLGTADRVRVSVHNEGEPIPHDDQQHLFEPFARGDRTTRAAGWGLGLTLVRGFTEAHGGRVSVESSRARGTTFTLDLPRFAAAA